MATGEECIYLVLVSDYTIYHHPHCRGLAKCELLTELVQLFARVFAALNLYFCGRPWLQNQVA